MNKKYFTGVFHDEESLVKAFGRLREAGIKPEEVYTPYPIHEILDGMGNKTRITHAAVFLTDCLPLSDCLASCIMSQ